jgi:hypothetical protein
MSESNRPILNDVSTQLGQFVVHVVSEFGRISSFKLSLFIRTPITWMGIIKKRDNSVTTRRFHATIFAVEKQ